MQSVGDKQNIPLYNQKSIEGKKKIIINFVEFIIEKFPRDLLYNQLVIQDPKVSANDFGLDRFLASRAEIAGIVRY